MPISEGEGGACPAPTVHKVDQQVYSEAQGHQNLLQNGGRQIKTRGLAVTLKVITGPTVRIGAEMGDEGKKQLSKEASCFMVQLSKLGPRVVISAISIHSKGPWLFHIRSHYPFPRGFTSSLTCDIVQHLASLARDKEKPRLICTHARDLIASMAGESLSGTRSLAAGEAIPTRPRRTHGAAHVGTTGALLAAAWPQGHPLESRVPITGHKEVS